MPNNRVLLSQSLFLLTLMTALVHPAMGQQDSQIPLNRDVIEIILPHGSVLTAEIADTPAKRSQGLMFRTSMPRNHGMLFIFNESKQWTFWMKNTKMPLDIIWLDAAQKVVHVEANVPICTRTDEGCPRYRAAKAARYVLELGAGMAQFHRITLGSQLLIQLPR